MSEILRYMDPERVALKRDEDIQKPDGMSRSQFAKETLARYSKSSLSQFQPFVLLTNFPEYVQTFAKLQNVPIISGTVLNVAHCKETKITIIDYQLGSPMAALIMDLISYTNPQCVLMLGLCGGLHRHHQVGDFLLPMAAIRDEGASTHYMPPQVPSLPALLIQQYVSQELMAQDIQFSTGVIHSTDYRMWEFDNKFIKNLREEKASAIDMECSALFTCGFKCKVPVGALMLISDLPLKPGGTKTQASSNELFKKYRELHLRCGINSILRMQEAMQSQNLNFRRFHFSAMS